MLYLPDTNILIALKTRRDRNVMMQMRLHRREVALSTIVLHELYYGAAKSARPQHNFAEIADLDFPVLPYDSDDARVAGEVRATLSRAGTPIGPYDALIAGQALARDMILVTHNVCEFARVSGLRLEDWTQA